MTYTISVESYLWSKEQNVQKKYKILDKLDEYKILDK